MEMGLAFLMKVNGGWGNGNLPEASKASSVML
jgi:hypothetical protein